MELMCNIFYCDKRGDRYCCHECSRRGMCTNPCANDPKKCGQSFDKPQKRYRCGNCAHAVAPYQYAGNVYCLLRQDTMMGICSRACEKYEQRKDNDT